MRSLILLVLSVSLLGRSAVCLLAATSSERAANTVILDAVAVKNLGIETVRATPASFEDVLFVLGRIEVIPAKRGVVSSRIPGRITALQAFEGDRVVRGQLVARVESRQYGDPPPTIDLNAPIDGLVMAGHAGLGEPVEPDTEILEIIDLGSVHAVARVPEDHVGQLEPGMRARIRIAALPRETFEGEMIRFGTRADPVGGTLDALFLLEDLAGQVRPQMRAEFSILLGSRENVTAIPRDAIQGDTARPYVFVKDFDLPNAFVKVPLVLGARNDHSVEVISGLFPGDEVVTSGSYPLAFAGAGSISLKEALDAAHGHEHNEDGSELTGEQKGGRASAESAEEGGAHSGLTLFFALLSGLLLLLLVLSLLVRFKPVSADA